MAIIINHDTNDITVRGGGTVTINGVTPGAGGGQTGFAIHEPVDVEPTATGTDAIAIGDAAVASNTQAVAFGLSATASGGWSTSIGSNSDATFTASVAIGGYAQALQQAAVAVGGDNASATNAATASAFGAVALGAQTDATQNYSTALGYAAQASGVEAIAIGGGSSTTLSANATAQRSIAMGFDSLASVSDAIAIGQNATAGGSDYNVAIGSWAKVTSGSMSLAIGPGNLDGAGAEVSANFSTAIGPDTSVTAARATALGYGATATRPNSINFGTGHTKIEFGFMPLDVTTTDATQTDLVSTGAGRLTIAVGTTVFFEAYIVARRTDADGESAAYIIKGCIDNNSGTTAMVGTINKEIVAEDTVAWDVTAEANDTDDRLDIKVTGEVSKTIIWAATVLYTEVIN